MRLCFDDHRSEFEFTEADGLDPALEMLAANQVDLLLMDLGMPGMAGADSLRDPGGLSRHQDRRCYRAG